MEKKIQFNTILIIFFLTYSPFLFGQGEDTSEKNLIPSQTVRVAVQAGRGTEAIMNKWSATMEYLSLSLEGYHFELVPLSSKKEMIKLVASESADFVITAPSDYIDLEYRYGIYHIATLINGRRDGGSNSNTGLVFTLKSRMDINYWEDIRDRSLMGVSPNDFGGWHIAWFEMLENGIDPYKDCSELLFSPDGSHENVVYSVLSGEADVGTIRSGILENMVERNLINPDLIKVINKNIDGANLLHSTRHYPGPAFSRLYRTPEVLSGKVQVALMQLSHNSKAALEGGYSGWSLPLDYSTVQDLLRTIKEPPYDQLGVFSFREVLKVFWKWILSGFIIFLCISFLLLFILRLHRKLTIRTRDLKKLNESLEKQIDERTADLITSNLKLKESEDKYRTESENLGRILNSLVDGVSIVNQDYRIEYVNPALINHIGLPGQKKCYDYFHNRSEPCTWCSMQNLEDGYLRRWEFETESDGRTYDLIDTAIRVSNNKLALLEISRDISKRKEAESIIIKREENLELLVKQRTLEIEESKNRITKSHKALIFLLEDIKSARKNLEEVNINLGRTNRDLEAFTYSVSHDLRSPLRAVLGFTSKLQRLTGESADPETHRLMDVIIDNANKMQELISDLLAYSRVGSSNLSWSDIDMNMLLVNVLSEFEMELKQKNISPIIQDLPDSMGNFSMIRQVFINLIENAIKFSSKGEGSSITIGYSLKKASYFVEDKGCGFDNSYSEEVFDIFKRVTDNKSIKGTGVGLAIVKRIIENHNGRVWAESEPEKGSVFYFTLHAE